MKIILNPQYRIINEHSCSYLVRKNGTIDKVIGLETPSVTLLPPSIGYIINSIGLYEYQTSVELLSKRLMISEQSIDFFIKQLIENEYPLKLLFLDHEIFFPKRVLIKVDDTVKYSSNMRCYEECGFKEKRPSVPITINFMVTTRCSTNCCYCYAKRNLSKELSTKEILAIIDECHEMGVVNLNLTGGDIFTRKDWQLLLKRTRDYNYYPFLSTKQPLTVDDLNYIKSIGIKDLQFSLDSVDPDLLHRIIASDNNYIDRLIHMFNDCEAIGLKLSIRSVLCSYNSNIEDFKELYIFLKGYNIIKDWVITPAFFQSINLIIHNMQLPRKQSQPSVDLLPIVNRYFQSF